MLTLMEADDTHATLSSMLYCCAVRSEQTTKSDTVQRIHAELLEWSILITVVLLLSGWNEF